MTEFAERPTSKQYNQQMKGLMFALESCGFDPNDMAFRNTGVINDKLVYIDFGRLSS